MKIRTITLCSSGAFYKDLLNISDDLINLGYKVLIPDTAKIMKKNNDFNIRHYKTWFKNPNDYKNKTKLMNGHFKKIIKGDAVLVVNKEKNGIKGYIGGNVLMEITLAYYLKKPIYILNKISLKHPFREEILGVNSIFLNGDIGKITK